MGHLSQFLSVTLVLLGLSGSGWADQPRIIDVRRSIPLSDAEPVYKDFYIKVEPGTSLKKDSTVTAVRKISIRESTAINPLGEITVPVGQLKVIFIENNIAVAREVKLLPRDGLPMLDQTAIMAGDLVQQTQ